MPLPRNPAEIAAQSSTMEQAAQIGMEVGLLAAAKMCEEMGHYDVAAAIRDRIMHGRPVDYIDELGAVIRMNAVTRKS